MEASAKRRKIASARKTEPPTEKITVPSASSVQLQQWSELPEDIIRKAISPFTRNSNARLACKSWARSFRVPRLCIGPTKARKTAAVLSELVALVHRVDVHTDAAVEFADLSIRHVLDAIISHFDTDNTKDLFAFYLDVSISENATLHLLGKVLCHPRCTLDTVIFNRPFQPKNPETFAIGPTIKYVRTRTADHFRPHPESRVMRFSADEWNNMSEFVGSWAQSLRRLELPFYHTSAATPQSLEATLTQFTQLETVIIAAAVDCNSLSELPKLRSLTYGSAQLRSHDGLLHNPDSILKSPSLEVAVLFCAAKLTQLCGGQFSATAARLTHLAVSLAIFDKATEEALSGLTSLKRLDLSVTTPEIPSQFMIKLAQLEELQLVFSRVLPYSKVKLGSVSPWFKHLTNLRKLNVDLPTWIKLQADAGEFFEALKGLTKLETLRISALDAHLFVEFAKVVSSLPALRSLAFGSVMDSNTSVKRKGNQDPLATLFDAIGASNVTRLSVKCVYTPAAYAALCELFKSPKCKIEALNVTVDTSKSGLLAALIQYGKLRSLELDGDIDESIYPAIQNLIVSMPNLVAFTMPPPPGGNNAPKHVKSAAALSQAVRSASQLALCTTEHRNDLHFYSEALDDLMDPGNFLPKYM
jgi:hypothetical protein